MTKAFQWLSGAAMILGAVLSTPAAAAQTSAAEAVEGISAEDAIAKFKANDPNVAVYVVGIKSGFEWANVWVRLYCQPVRMALTADQAVSITEQFLEGHKPQKGGPLGMVMLNALVDLFPCPVNEAGTRR
jgi:hypothetical protein